MKVRLFSKKDPNSIEKYFELKLPLVVNFNLMVTSHAIEYSSMENYHNIINFGTNTRNRARPTIIMDSEPPPVSWHINTSLELSASPPHWGSNPRTSVCEPNALPLTPQQTLLLLYLFFNELFENDCAIEELFNFAKNIFISHWLYIYIFV